MLKKSVVSTAVAWGVIVCVIMFSSGDVQAGSLTASGTSEAMLYWTTSSPSYDWHFGLDGNDSGKLKLGASSTFGNSNKMTLDRNGRVGIGTTSPGYLLDVWGSFRATGNISLDGGDFVFNDSGDISNFRMESDIDPFAFFLDGYHGRVGISTSSPDSLLHIHAGISGNNPSSIADLTIEDDGSDDYNCATIQLLSPRYNYILFGDDDDNDNGQIIYRHSVGTMVYNDMIFKTNGSSRYRITKNGVLIFDSPTSDPGNSVLAQMWTQDVSGTKELRVRDTANNATTISPHNFSLYEPAADDPLPWSYYSRNTYVGKEINVDMSGAIRELERISGKQFIHLQDLPAEEVADAEAGLIDMREQERQRAKERELEQNPWIEIPLAKAWEEVAEMEDVKVTTTIVEYQIDWALMEAVPVEIEKTIMREAPTGPTIKRLKQDVRFDKATGKCYRRRTLEDVVLDQATIDKIEALNFPAYVRERLPIR